MDFKMEIKNLIVKIENRIVYLRDNFHTLPEVPHQIEELNWVLNDLLKIENGI